MFDHQSVVVPKPAPASNYVLVGDRHRLNLGPLGDAPGDRPNPGGTERIGGHTADGYVYGLSGREGGVEGGAVLRLYPYDANRSPRAAATPAMSPPPPTASTTTSSFPGICSTSSKPTVPWPAHTSTWS